MALAKDMMGGGLSAGQAHAIQGAANTAVSAAGTTQATATEITSSLSDVTTVGANSGVRLFNASHRDSMFVYNSGANALAVYPPVGSRIYPAATNAAITLATNTGIMLWKLTSTKWVGILSA